MSVLKDASDYQHSGVETSVGRQFHECLAYCEREGWTVAQTYPDDGYSASSGRRRPSFEQLIADVEADQLDVVVVWKLDRLMRSMRDFVRVWEACQKHGARLVSVADHMDTSVPLGKAMAQVGVVFAEIEVGNTSLRVKRAYDAIRRTGQPLRIGRRPFGWAPDRVTPLRDSGNLTWTVKRKPEGGGQPVEVDVLIERSDLGPGAATLIAKGDPIPPELAGLPRRPRAPKPKGRRR